MSGNQEEFITLSNGNGLTASFASYGARWTSMCVPDNKGHLADVLLGFDTIDDYKYAFEQYHGAVVGRVCGRIRNAVFNLNGERHELAANDVYGKPVRNHLHGGIEGFHRKAWNAKRLMTEKGDEGVIFTLFSPDGEEGYPGNLSVSVTYVLRADNALEMIFEGVTDAPTHVNLTNHAFFNLTGDFAKTVSGHLLRLDDCSLIECDENLLPIGRMIDLQNDSLGFHGDMSIGEAIARSRLLSVNDGGISQAYAFNEGTEHSIYLFDPVSGRNLRIVTDCPSVQVYNAYLMDGSDKGKGGVALNRFSGIALEPQGFPDAPNNPQFPTTLLLPGEVMRVKNTYFFGNGSWQVY